jgi:hypothetical protein
VPSRQARSHVANLSRSSVRNFASEVDDEMMKDPPLQRLVVIRGKAIELRRLASRLVTEAYWLVRYIWALAF